MEKLSRVIANSSLGRGLYPLDLTQQIAYNSYLVRTFILSFECDNRQKEKREREREKQRENARGRDM